MPRQWIIVAVGGLAVLLLLAGTAAFVFERPTRLTVAVSNADPDDAALIEATAKLVKFGRRSVRLKVVRVPDAAAAAAAVDDRKAELAVVRTDVAVPREGQTVVILHRDAAILVAPASSPAQDLAALSGNTVGIFNAGPGNRHLLDAVLAQYDIGRDAVKTLPLAPAEIAEAIRTQRVAAILAVGVVPGEAMTDIVRMVAEAGGGPPVFIPIAEADAIAQRLPVYESIKIVRGAFGGASPRPDDEYDTLGITHRLVARESVDADAITDLTRFLLNEKPLLSAVVPLALRIEAPSTDKGLPNPVHAGAAAYIDDDEETFFDKYSDYIYIGAMLIGVLASGATALLSRMNTHRSKMLDSALARLVDMLALIRTAPTAALLDRLQGEADGLLAAAFASRAAEDERRFAAFGLALAQVHAAVSDRRQVLAGAAARPGRDTLFSQALAGE